MQNKTVVKKGVGLALSYAMISGGAWSWGVSFVGRGRIGGKSNWGFPLMERSGFYYWTPLLRVHHWGSLEGNCVVRQLNHVHC
jgi:hypothetical protein